MAKRFTYEELSDLLSSGKAKVASYDNQSEFFKAMPYGTNIIKAWQKDTSKFPHINYIVLGSQIPNDKTVVRIPETEFEKVFVIVVDEKECWKAACKLNEVKIPFCTHI